MNEQIETNFNSHKLDYEDIDKCDTLRAEVKSLAYNIAELCPDSREKALAMTKLEEAMFWANAAISRNQEE